MEELLKDIAWFKARREEQIAEAQKETNFFKRKKEELFAEHCYYKCVAEMLAEKLEVEI